MRKLTCPILLGWLAWTAPTRAEPRSDCPGLLGRDARAASGVDRAKLHFTSGVDAYQRGDYRSAVDQLLCADQEHQSPLFTYNIALTYEAMQDAVTALMWFREFLRMSHSGAEADVARGKVAELEARLQARGVQQVTIRATPDGAIVRVDGEAAGVTPLTEEFSPGRHRYEVSATGYESQVGVFELRADRSQDVLVRLRALDAPQSAAPSGKAFATPATPVWPWLVLTGGVTALGASLALEVVRRSGERTLRDEPQTLYQRRYDALAAQQFAARALGLGGLVMVGGGAWLWSQQRQPTNSVGLGACPDGGLCGRWQRAF